MKKKTQWQKKPARWKKNISAQQLEEDRQKKFDALKTRFISEGYKCTRRNKEKMIVCPKCYYVTMVKAHYQNDNKKRVAQVCLECGHEVLIEAVQLTLF